MAITDQTFYKSRQSWLGDMLAQLQAAITDVFVGEDGVIRILFEIQSAQLENLSLANQILLEDMFVQTASLTALKLHGQQYGIAMSEGALSQGFVRFSGDDGTRGFGVLARNAASCLSARNCWKNGERSAMRSG